MTPTDQTPDSDHHARRKRSREELENLAQNFVAAPVETGMRAPLSRKQLMIAGGIGGALLLVLVAVLLWPSGESEEDATRQSAQAERATQEAEQWKQRFEAERERKRKELQGGKEYLERIAAADNALLKDMQGRAQQLAARAAAEPAPAPAATAPRGAPTQEPTPRDESKSGSKAPAAAPTPAQPSTQTAQAKPQPAPEPAKPAPTPTPAPSQPQVASAAPPAAAQAKPAECTIHVSELSSSGKLTYEDIKRMKGARLDEKTGHVFTPRVKAGNGQSVIFEVLPTGCVQVVRSSLGG